MVTRKLDDRDAREKLRSDLRRQARADKLRIITREYDDLVIAMLNRTITGDFEIEARNAIRDAHAVADVAKRLGHQPRVASREHVESVAFCTVCNALGHADGTADDVVLAGPLYSDPCIT